MTRLVPAYTLLLGIAQASVSLNIAQAAEPIRCSCLFSQASGYTAVGTGAVCSTFTHNDPKKKGEACEVAFGGTGYQEPLISKLGFDLKKYRDTAFSVTQANLAAVASRNPKNIFNAKFLQTAIPIYMRAAYLRVGSGIDDETLLDLDKQVMAFSSEFAQLITDVFLGKVSNFEKKLSNGHLLVVERGAVRFVYASQITLVAIIFDPQDLK